MEDTCLVVRCPDRASGSHIPVEVYEEIFGWLRPTVDPDTNARWYRKTLACMALVCRYFAFYATQEFYRSLDFGGAAQSVDPQRPTDTWCNGVLTRLQPMETPRSDLTAGRELHDWIPQLGRQSLTKEFKVLWMEDQIFITRLPLVLPRLENLRFFALVHTRLSHLLMQSLGRLRALQQLVLLQAYADWGRTSRSEPIFGPHETPFPTLCQLTVERMFPPGDDAFRNAICALGGATKLRSLAVDDGEWLRCFLPHITPQLVSLSGNFSSIPVQTFLEFIRGHAALENLTVYFHLATFFESSYQDSYRDLHLDPDDFAQTQVF
ncbi:hypothetical protein JB92DRAFT_1553291 [Gautieria morchelliformis]|nr:hypothetical protein JB92DRAFT_1553291 [Gautieria morchelliformis]